MEVVDKVVDLSRLWNIWVVGVGHNLHNMDNVDCRGCMDCNDLLIKRRVVVVGGMIKTSLELLGLWILFLLVFVCMNTWVGVNYFAHTHRTNCLRVNVKRRLRWQFTRKAKSHKWCSRWKKRRDCCKLEWKRV